MTKKILINGQEQEVILQTHRLSFGKKEEIRRRISIHQFTDYDWSKLDDNGDPTVKTHDALGLQTAQQDALIETTKILWGIENADINSIPAEDFEFLLNAVQELKIFEKKVSGSNTSVQTNS